MKMAQSRRHGTNDCDADPTELEGPDPTHDSDVAGSESQSQSQSEPLQSSRLPDHWPNEELIDILKQRNCHTGVTPATVTTTTTTTTHTGHELEATTTGTSHGGTFTNTGTGPGTGTGRTGGQYRFTVGLVLLSFKGSRRLSKHAIYRLPSEPDDTEPIRVWQIACHYCCAEDRQNYLFRSEGDAAAYQSPTALYDTAYELSKKALTINPKHIWEFYHMPLLPRDPTNGLLVFPEAFLRKVAAFHDQVRRPEGTYDEVTDPRVRPLVELPREACPGCGGSRQIFCGECKGVRIPSAEALLPARIALPFDVLLVLHRQERLHKCTGIHVGALCSQGTVDVVDWPRVGRGEDCSSIVAAFDSDRDVLLFPCADAVSASDVRWQHDVPESEATETHETGHSSSYSDSQRELDNSGDKTPSRSRRPGNKKRLIVLEASWQHAKTMYNEIARTRHRLSLPPIACVKLEGIVGQYWRFHCEGNSAVSTIEAIACAARVAGLSEKQWEDLLLLFYVQKHRVLSRLESDDPEELQHVPQTICVEGTGVGSWVELTSKVR